MSFQSDFPPIAILMATYNGEPYLQEQIDSIIQQSYTNWRLYIRDDGSTDNTLLLLHEYSAKDDRIMVVGGDSGNLGSARNFGCLLQHAFDAGEIFFCLSDQDDVWSENKLYVLMQAMSEAAGEGGTPLLIHSDLCVTDQQMNELHPSFMEYQRLGHQTENVLNTLLVQNFVTGCTVLMNRELVGLALPIPVTAVMHDWWLALCAAAFGEIRYVPIALVKYRQHGANVVGAKSYRRLLNPFRTNWVKQWLKGRKNLQGAMLQAKELAELVWKCDRRNGNLVLIDAYASLLSQSRWQRIEFVYSNGIRCQSNLRHYLMLSRLFSLLRQSAI